MTIKQAWEGMLTELNKVNAPSMLLQDFNYFFNKAIDQYINKRYNIYDINQQTSDDLRVLKATAELVPSNIQNGIKEVISPHDYLHLLNCICTFKINSGKKFKCYKSGEHIQYSAKRLTADSWSVILSDYYNRPTPQRPYYYIHNTNDLIQETVWTDVDNSVQNASNTITLSELLNSDNLGVVNKENGERYGNASNVRIEIRYGSDDILTLDKVNIDYLKTPKYYSLTQDQLDSTDDTSQVLEFPDYVCQQIINELVYLVLENNSDPRLKTNPIVTQSIASPVQQQ